MRAISLLKSKNKKGVAILAPKNKNYEMVSLKNIKKGLPFITLFPINPEVMKAISDDMKINDFDQSQPVIIWKEANILIDGHTRCAAAEKAGLTYVYAIYESFPDVDSALRYAYGLQFKRRNLTDADRFHFSETYLNNVGQGAKKSGWKKKELAEILSVSTGTAQKYISVLSRGSKQDQEAVRSGEKTINSVYNSLLDREKPEDKTTGSVKKKTTEKADKNTDNTVTLNLSMIRETLDNWAKEMNVLRAYLYPFRERIEGLSEILPQNSEIRNYALSLIEVQEEEQ
jgi:ParB-like chromosome segregation protein Spo0J